MRYGRTIKEPCRFSTFSIPLNLFFSRRYLTSTMSNRYKSKEAIRVQLRESAKIRKRESLEMVEATLVST